MTVDHPAPPPGGADGRGQAATVAAAWGWRDAELVPLTGGLINTTFAVRRDGVPIAVLQRLHPTFAAECNLDLEAVTAHLAARGLTTPRLVRTLDGRAWVEAPTVDATAPPSGGAAGPGQARTVDATAPPSGGAAGPGQARTVDATAPPSGGAAGPGQARTVDATAPPSGGAAGPGQARTVVDGGRVWRALTWVAGDTVHAVPSPAWAAAAGALVGDYHRAVADLAYDYRAVRAGVHDTAAHLAQLRALVTSVARERVGEAADGGAELEAAIELGDHVLAAADALPALPVTPRRHVHGDLKISNVLFAHDAAAVRGVCLVDLDTLGTGTIAFELGDAMRSWCNPRGEDAGAVAFDLPIFAAAVGAFRDVAGALVSRAELASIVIGLETVCIELAARFAVDVFRDSYFGWDAVRFPSRRAHNLVRARGQLALGLAVRAAHRDAIEIVLAGT